MFLLTWSFSAAFIILQNVGAYVAQPLQHSHIAICAKWCCEANFFFILSAEPLLVIAKKIVQQSHYVAIGCGVNYCHTPFRDSGNEASILVPRMFYSHV
jgi:hypothetical protein